MNKKHKKDIEHYRETHQTPEPAPVVVGVSRSLETSFSSPPRTPKPEPKPFNPQTKHCDNLRPFGIVEDNRLRKLMHFVQSIQGTYNLPSRRTITEKTEVYADQLRHQMKTRIGNEADFYSITTDIWTSRATEIFIVLTAHNMLPLILS